MFDIGPAEIVVIVVAAVLLFGPEKLPELARKAARVIVYVRGIANNAQTQISSELGPGFENFDIRDPKGSIRRHIMDQVEPIVADVQDEVAESKKVFTDTKEDLVEVRSELEGLTSGPTDGPVGPADAADDPESAETDRDSGDDADPAASAAEPEPVGVSAPAVVAGAPYDRDAT